MTNVDIILIKSSYNAEVGDVINVEPDRAESLVATGAARYPDAGELSSRPATVDDILGQVGSDKALAQAALETEQAAARPRTGLVKKLEAILAAD